MPSKIDLRAFLGCLSLAVLVLAASATAAHAQGFGAQTIFDENDPLRDEPKFERVAPTGGLSVGPDVTIIDLLGVGNYSAGGGTACPPGYGAGNCRGFSIGTNSCGRGTVPVDWCDENSGCRTTIDAYHPIAPATNTDHSVIGQNMYRLLDGRFEQIGFSFLKHGFVSTNSNDSDCTWNDNGVENSTCIQPPAGGDQLGLGCTDFYGSGLNGSRSLGRRSQVNGASGDHPENPAGGETDDTYDQRIVVAEANLIPSADGQAPLYWMEGQYIVRDDSRSSATVSPPPPLDQGGGTLHPWLGKNGLNNASYREATVSGSLQVAMTGPTFREQAAIYAWQSVDPEVEIVTVDRQTFFPGDPVDPPAPAGDHPDHWVVERFEAARRIYEPVPLEEGVTMPYRYEYAIHNLNSDSSADGFTIAFQGSAAFANVGFTDIDHHSGEPFDTADWSIAVDEANGTITWTAVDMGANTNALRWGTTFSFYFESNRPPTVMTHSLDLFKIPGEILVGFPSLGTMIFKDGFESGSTSRWDEVIP